jgi:hypothetical protein
MTIPLTFRNFFHTGYVVRNADKVMENMQDKFGIAKWKILRLGKGYAATALAYAYTQNAMIELVEVNLTQELRVIHRDWIPDSDTDAKLNHLAYLVDDEAGLEPLIENFKRAGLATAWRAGFRDVFSEYCYIDTVAQLGHFCEFACLGPAGRDFLADIPRN